MRTQKTIFFLIIVFFLSSFFAQAQTIETIVLSESFESWPPQDWILSPDTGRAAWKQDDCKATTPPSPGKAKEGSYAAMANYFNMPFGTTSLTTPTLDLANVRNPVLSFYWANNSETEVDYKPKLTIWATFDDSTYHQIDSIITTNINGWQSYERGLDKRTKRIRISAVKRSVHYINTFLDVFTIKEGASCVLPEDQGFQLGAKNAQVLLGWNALNGANKWNLKIASKSIDPVKDAGDVLDTMGVMFSANGESNFLAENLEIGKTYYWYIQTDCGSSQSIWSKEKYFLVDHAPARLPFRANFDNDFDGFTLVNGKQKNQWIRGNIPLEGKDGQCAYISPNGNAYEYTNSAKVRVHIYREIIFPEESKNGFKLSFDWLCNGSKYNDVMKVYVITDMSVYPIAGQWINQLYQEGPYFSLNKEWKRGEVELPASFAGQRVRLAFSWMNTDNESEGGGQPPIALDNIELTLLECSSPKDLKVSEVGKNSALLQWIQEGSTTLAWNIEYGESGFKLGSGRQIKVTTNPYRIENLLPGTRYDFYVQGICDSGLLSQYTNYASIATSCEAKQAPYFDNFDNLVAEEFPLCFTQLATTGSVYHLAHPGYARSKPNAMIILSADVKPNDFLAFISPEFSDIQDLNKRVKFWANIFPSLSLKVGVMKDPKDQTTFLQLAKFNGIDLLDPYVGAPEMRQLTVDLTNPKITTDHRYIAFLYGNEYYMKPISIDDFSYELIPSCLEPLDLQMKKIDLYSAKASWTPGGNETSWEVVYGKIGFDPNSKPNLKTVSLNEVEFDNLEVNTMYEVYVRALCGGEDKSPWSAPIKFRTPVIMEVPFAEGFEYTYPGTLTPYWNSESQTASTWHVVTTAPYSEKQCLFIEGKENMNDWAFTPGINLRKGKTYTLKFYYRALGGFSEELDVYMGTGSSSAQMDRTPLLQIDSVKGDYKAFSVSVSISTDATYYFGWHAKSKSSKGMRLDDVQVLLGTDIEVASDKVDVKIHPNPADDNLYIEFDGTARIEILNYVGMTVKVLPDYKGGREIYTGDLKQGMYIVRISKQDRIIEKKIIIKH